MISPMRWPEMHASGQDGVPLEELPASGRDNIKYAARCQDAGYWKVTS